MENDKVLKLIVGIVSIFIIILSIDIIFNIFNKTKESKDSNKIPDNYIAIFNGESGEITHQTYIYKINKNKENYKFKYINTINTTEHWGSSNWKIKIIKEGKIKSTDEVFEVAKNNNAYSYVTIPNSDEKYIIEEYKKELIK